MQLCPSTQRRAYDASDSKVPDLSNRHPSEPHDDILSMLPLTSPKRDLAAFPGHSRPFPVIARRSKSALFKGIFVSIVLCVRRIRRCR